jgi:hypothetical protein
MAKPDYETLLHEIAIETDPVKKAELEAQCYVFTEELTDAEKNLFNYVQAGYIEKNPDKDSYIIDPLHYPFVENKKSPSYVGVYFYEKVE